MSEQEEVLCPECATPMVLKETTKYRYPNSGKPRKFWSCPRWPQCDGIHGAHPDGSPVGVPADKETKQWRIKAHAAFDRLWQVGDMGRGQAYQWLAKQMDKKEVHIGEMGIDECQQVIQIVQESE